MDDAPSGFVAACREAEKIEAVVACVGFDDLLDISLAANLPHLDSLLVVTTAEDAQTIRVCRKYGARVMQTDQFTKDGRVFAKGAGLNAGLTHCRFRGWRLVLDADILLPDNFRRVLLNHTTLDQQCLYGADRMDVIGPDALTALPHPQWGLREEVQVEGPIRARLVTAADGYLPLGYFQLSHAACFRSYPSSPSGAGLDDVLYAQLWPASHRRLLPSVIVYHLCGQPPVTGENWDGVRRSPRLV